jgi:nicotinate-nucleotide adenylyltransferase
MKAALLGGSFDPPHTAHLQVLQYLLKEKKYDQLWVVPTSRHPFKRAEAPFEDRLAMCRLAFDGLDKKVKVLDIEKDLSGYTVDLVKELYKREADLDLTWVGGSDLKTDLDRWKDSAELKKMLRFEFLPRPPEKNSPFLPVSSTEIREQIKQGQWPKESVPQAVLSYIQKHGLYGNRGLP